MTNIYHLATSADLFFNITRQLTASGEEINLEEIDQIIILPNTFEHSTGCK
jgi:hypothetical protein